MVGLNFTFAPPSRLVKSFFVTGVIFYLISSILFFGIDLTNLTTDAADAVAFVHLFLVGFVMSVIFGAMYQLISVVLEVKLFSDKLAYTHLAMFILGLISFIVPLLLPKYFAYLSYGGSILYLSFLLYVINIMLSIMRVKKKEIKFFTIFFVHLALLIGVSYGLLGAFGLSKGELNLDTAYIIHTHIPLVAFVFVGGLISIIATVLLPMFLLSHNFDKRVSNILLVLLIFATFFAIIDWQTGVQIVVVLTLISMSYQLYDIFKKRMRKNIDIYAKDMITSILSLTLLAPLILFLDREGVVKFFVLVLFLGFLSSFVVGHIYKIVPFLIWNEKYAPLVGKQKVPMLNDMVSQKLSTLEFYFKLAALFGLLLGLGIGSSKLLLVGKLLFLINAVLLILNLKHIFLYKE
jgi:hypothetical protein